MKCNGKIVRGILSSLLLLLVVGLPTEFDFLFDGLPWVNHTETITIIVVIPALIFLGRGYLSVKPVLLGLFVLMLFKVILLISTPSSGWAVKVYPTEADYLNSRWVSTYQTLWNSNASGVINEPWAGYREFPMEWAVDKLTSSTKWQEAHEMQDIKDPSNTKPWLELSGSLRVPPDHTFILIVTGITQGKFETEDVHGKKKTVPRIDAQTENLEGWFESPIKGSVWYVEEGVWRVSGRIGFEGNRHWAIIPLIKTPSGTLIEAHTKDILFQSLDLKNRPQRLQILRAITLVFDLLVIMFFVVWAIWALFQQKIRRDQQLPLGLAMVLAVALPYPLFPLIESYLSGNLQVASLGLGVGLAGAGYLFWLARYLPSALQNADKQASHIFLLFGPAILLFFVIHWWPEIGRTPILSPGDDWTSYQVLAFRITLLGDWRTAGGEAVFMHQPLYRYITALFHWLFGKSMFAQKFFDVWCVIGATLVIVVWLRKTRVDFIYILVASLLFLLPILIGPLRHHIGRGLAEYSSMFFMLLAFWLFLLEQKRTRLIVLAGACGLLAYWTRQDHLFVIAAGVFLLVEPVKGSLIEVWRAYLTYLKIHWRNVAIFLGLIGFGVLAVAMRNWLVGGHFGLSIPDHPNLVFAARCCDENGESLPVKWQPIFFYEKIRLMIAMKKVGQFPSPFSIPIIVGSCVGILFLVWRPHTFHQYPMALGLLLLGVFTPYYFVNNWGYPPRFSIHLLPISVVSTVVFAHCLTGNITNWLRPNLKSRRGV